MLPFYLLYWVGQGNLLLKVSALGVRLSLESAVLGTLLLTATVALPFWNWVAQKYSKRTAYILGMVFWIVVQVSLLKIQPGEIGLIIGFSLLAGLSVSTAHVMPEALFPDVIDWDELKTNERNEGMYYGAVNFVRKLSSAFAIFFALQVLGWSGYHAPTGSVTGFIQSPNTLWAIRLLTGPVVAVILFAAIGLAWYYPITRDRQLKIRDRLNRRQNKLI
jgi:GPH family glycoside/pentoside/hexuronide:cation symporter